MDYHVHRSTKENSLEIRVEVRKVSSRDRISQRTVQQIEAPVVKIVLHGRIWERDAEPLYEEPKFASQDQKLCPTMELFLTLLVGTLLLFQFSNKHAVLSE